MYKVINRDEGTIEFGGRVKGNWGKIAKVRKIGNGRLAVLVVTRCGDRKERVYGSRAARRFLAELE